MQFLFDLWLPILINGVVLFFASFAAWVLLPHHFGDRKTLPAEDTFMQFLREQDVAPGNYMFPYTATKAEQQSKEHMEKYAAGPRGCLDVYDMPNMPANMAKTVAFFLVTSAVIGYITHVACPPGGDGVDFHASLPNRGNDWDLDSRILWNL